LECEINHSKAGARQMQAGEWSRHMGPYQPRRIVTLRLIAGLFAYKGRLFGCAAMVNPSELD
jgi:hypothetical protein